MLGNMMPTQLTITMMMNHGQRRFSNTPVVSITHDDNEHNCTLGDVFERAAQLAHFFNKYQLPSGARIGTLAWNDYRHLELYFGVACYGAVCHTINPRLHPEQITFIVNDARDEILFIDPMFIDLIRPIREHLHSVNYIVVLSGDEALLEGLDKDWLLYEDIIAFNDTQYDWPELDENMACSLCYTSGTTGNPKGVLYSHRSIVLHAMAEIAPDAVGVSWHDAILPVVPMFHVNAWGLPYVAAITGCKLVFAGPKTADAETLSHLFEKHQVTITAGVPTVWKLLRDYLEGHEIKLTSLKKLMVGGSAMPPGLYQYFEQQQNLRVIHLWGMTELTPMGTVNHTQPHGMSEQPEQEQLAHKLRQGYPAFGVELKIVNDEGKSLPWDGETSGNLLARGPWVVNQYFNSPDTNLHGGWFDTGDIACMTPDGSMKITDRKKDVIKSGGEWISSIDIENAMMLHPKVAMAAVIGVNHPRWDERPLLIIEKNAHEALSLHDVHTWLSGKVAKWWFPDDITYVEALPLTATGKVH